MNKKLIKVCAICMTAVLLIFLPGIWNAIFDLYLDVTMKKTGKLPTVNSQEKLEELLTDNIVYYTNSSSLPTISSSTKFKLKSFDDIDISSDLEYSGKFYNYFEVPNSFNASSNDISSIWQDTASSTSSSYSSTNVQVDNVDEGDILKNDGKYIYTVSDNKVIIVSAFPANELRKLSEINIDKKYEIRELYIEGNKLFVITVTGTYSDTSTRSLIFDITNRENPVLIKEFEIKGNFDSSRKVDNRVYVFTSLYASKNNLPQYRENTNSNFKEISLDEIQYVPNTTGYTDYINISAFDLNMQYSLPNIVTYLANGNSAIYMSQDNLYMAQKANSETTVYKFDLKYDYPRYVNRATVDGTIVNQFAMDEYNGFFRIATTKGSTNSLYIFSESMYKLGSVNDFAPGEQIKSVRFEGDRAYVVTFRNTDPLFVIDVSKPRSPIVLGKLKIEGYSTYLQTYDENHLIGFGYDGTSTGINGKLKIALFDVTDVENPRTMFVEKIDATNAELLTNHKSLLFSKERNLIAFSTNNSYYNKDTGKVYTISLEEGFKLRGEIVHQYSDVLRMIYMDDFLYGVSEEYISAHNIYNAETIKIINF